MNFANNVKTEIFHEILHRFHDEGITLTGTSAAGSSRVEDVATVLEAMQAATPAQVSRIRGEEKPAPVARRGSRCRGRRYARPRHRYRDGTLMTTRLLFREDAYLREAEAKVIGHTPEGGKDFRRCLGVLCHRRRPAGRQRQSGMGGGRAVDRNRAEGGSGPDRADPGRTATAAARGRHRPPAPRLERRHRLMRVHTALHLLSVVIPLPVTGRSVRSPEARLRYAGRAGKWRR